ncbi:S41 family peptidase [Qipengyuania sp. DSG2-2]|uniref:S41 family peptidase n=1 Tax=Qipengyuania sp. DGS2-2 TaxID=3349631 RepID=UPI0036D266B2
MGIGRNVIAATLAVSLAACGGGDSSSSNNFTASPTPTPPSTGGTCSLASRQQWAREQIEEWYLFPDLLDLSVDPAAFTSVNGYINALVAPARAQSRDRFFTYVTSIEEENAFFASGSTAGFGIRLSYDTANNRVFVLEAFENAPAFASGFDRGTEIIALGERPGALEDVGTIMAAEGPQGIVDRLGPSDAGVTRSFRIRPRGGAVTAVTVSKADFPLDPVSDRYGAQVLNDGGKLVGYINLRTFIDTAESDLRTAYDAFRQQGVREVIVDFRYNGGGLVRTAELMGDLMGAGRVGSTFSFTTFRPSKSENNVTEPFEQVSQAIAPTKIAFIGRGGTASASELVANSFIPYLGNNTALIGENTFGKPVGQIGLDQPECDDRLRVVAFQSQNVNGEGEYFTGLASVFPQTCEAADDVSNQLGDPAEASVAKALGFLRGETCSAIAGTNGEQGVRSVGPRQQLLQAAEPTVAQRETPGLF